MIYGVGASVSLKVLALGRWFFVFFLLSSLSGFAQTHVNQNDLTRESLTQSPPQSQPPLDLKGAVKMAIDNNNNLKRARAKIEQDRWDTRARWALIYPN